MTAADNLSPVFLCRLLLGCMNNMGGFPRMKTPPADGYQTAAVLTDPTSGLSVRCRVAFAERVFRFDVESIEGEPAEVALAQEDLSRNPSSYFQVIAEILRDQLDSRWDAPGYHNGQPVYAPAD